MQTVWDRFGWIQRAWAKVQGVCDFVHGHLRFDYGRARPMRTAAAAMNEQVGACRDFTHPAVTAGRRLNIPTRYCNGYLGDIGVPPDPAPMDFNAWSEAYRRAVVHVRCPPQHAVDWTHPGRSRTRRHGHTHAPHVRPSLPSRVPSHYQGGAVWTRYGEQH